MSLKSSEKIETNRYELVVEVPGEEFKKAVMSVYRKNAGKISVPGFRKGKAPKNIIERMYGKEFFYEDAVNIVYPDSLEAAVKETELEIVDDKIDFDIEEIGDQGLIYKVKITTKPEVELGEYKGLQATRQIAKVLDSEVDAEINKLRERNSRMITIDDRPAQTGDITSIDFEGFLDGEPFDGGKAEGYSLTLGGGEFIPGFEDQVAGHNAGDEFDVNVTFPEDYGSQELAGKPVVFKVKLHEIKFKELPDADDEFAKDVSEFDTLEEYKADVAVKILEQKNSINDEEVENQLIDQIIGGMKAEIPQCMIDKRVDGNVGDFEYRLQSQGMNLETYLQYTNMEMDAFRKTFDEIAGRQVRVRLALEKIVAAEGIEVSDEELDAELAKVAEKYKLDIEKVKQMVSVDEIRKDLAVGKAVDLVKSSAQVSEKEADAAEEGQAEVPQE